MTKDTSQAAPSANNEALPFDKQAEEFMRSFLAFFASEMSDQPQEPPENMDDFTPLPQPR